MPWTLQPEVSAQILPDGRPVSAEVWELVQLMPWKSVYFVSSSRWMMLNMVLGAAYVSDGVSFFFGC